MSLKHLIVGGDSLIAKAISYNLRKHGQQVITTTRNKKYVSADSCFLDLSCIGERVELPDADVVYLLASISEIKKCESDPEGTARINVDAISVVAEHYVRSGAFVVFYSTDRVFDGSKERVEASASTCPVSVYGQQKATVEKRLLGQPGKVAIVRLGKVISPSFSLFRGWVSSLMKQEQINCFADMHFAPVGLNDVVRLSYLLTTLQKTGIWQLTAHTDISYMDAGCYIAKKLGVSDGLVVPQQSHEFGIIAQNNPRHTTLSCLMTEEELSLPAPDPYMCIQDFLSQYDCKF